MDQALVGAKTIHKIGNALSAFCSCLLLYCLLSTGYRLLLIDTGAGRVLNPQPSLVAFGNQFASSQGPLKMASPMLSVSGMTGVTVERTELKLRSRLEAVTEGAEAVAEFLKRTGVSEELAFGIDMAVREGIANAVIHGNRLDDNKTVAYRYQLA